MMNPAWKSGAGLETILFRKVVVRERRDVADLAAHIKRRLAGLLKSGFLCR